MNKYTKKDTDEYYKVCYVFNSDLSATFESLAFNFFKHINNNNDSLEFAKYLKQIEKVNVNHYTCTKYMKDLKHDYCVYCLQK